jgi:hypothetical protein
MKALVPVVVVILSGSVACAASAPVPVTEPRPASSCESLAREAAARVDAVLAAHRACGSDADCTTVPQGASCFDHCTTAIARSGEPALQAIVADVDAKECHDFAAEGCRVVPPPCMAPAATTCRSGMCQ